MDFGLNKCCTDRLSSLPGELICEILSSLPTKDAAIVSLSSKNMKNAFMYLTTLDIDDSPIPYCGRKNPKLAECFQIFKTFVNNVLEKSQSPYLRKFRLGFGGDFITSFAHFENLSSECGKHCFPDLEPTVLNSWISFPLSRCGVREIDLRIHVREPEKLPSALFTCETLEVLKLDTNLDFKLVSDTRSFRLPNLKVLELHSIVIPEDDFVGRIVSSCPLLQELNIDCWWIYAKSVTISSPVLQKLVLTRNMDYQYGDPPDFVNIDTPNLQYFEYEDKLAALHYSVTTMKAPVQAIIHISYDYWTAEGCIRRILNLVKALRNVQNLKLFCSSVEVSHYEDLQNQLPTFHNLKHLVFSNNASRKWDIVSWEFLMRSPVLEVLEFLDGIDPWFIFKSDPSWVFRKNQVTCYFCKPRLKRIAIKRYRGQKWEVEFISLFLENAPALEELLVKCIASVDKALTESILKKLPTASSACLIIVQ